ncbi:MAG: hypothetical protein ACSHYA_11095 [Opitutaceae bacterium]
MRLKPQSIRLTDAGILVDGPLGAVLIQRRMDRIETKYQGDQLVNGNATAYCKKLFEQAVEIVDRSTFPWRIETDGTLRITDHQRFYDQTFKTDLRGIETLKQWMDRP